MLRQLAHHISENPKRRAMRDSIIVAFEVFSTSARFTNGSMTGGSNQAAGTWLAGLDDAQAHAGQSEPCSLSMLGSPLETLNDYQILEYIGGGTFGEVIPSDDHSITALDRTRISHMFLPGFNGVMYTPVCLNHECR